MKIGIIDADLIGRSKHRFPNLASMKISGYYKSLGNDVSLLLDYENLNKYDKVFISKVFTDTYVPQGVLNLNNVEYGGTGFFYDKAIPLPYEIEHHMPDYSLYDEWIKIQLDSGTKKSDLTYYIDYSIGFTTRGCFRKCGFCVNKNSNKVNSHSNISEFLDPNRKYICLLDDNVLGSPNWEQIFNGLNSTGKRFQYKQGMDERLLTDKKCEVLLNSNYIGDYIFAFDNINDKELIETKLKLWNKHRKSKNKICSTKFYVFCGFDRNDIYDENFWKKDIEDTFERIKVLMRYNCLPYIMRHENYNNSPYRGTYVNLARWCNQPNFYKKKSYREFCETNQKYSKKLCAAMRYLQEFENKYPEISKKYFDLRYEDLKEI